MKEAWRWLMRIVVLGAGALGSLYGGRLHGQGAEVVLVDVWREHVEAINRNGLRIDGPEETKVVHVPACLPQQVHGKADLVMIFTKTFHTQEALEGIKTCLDDHTMLMTLQNGLGNAERLLKYVGPHRIIVGTTSFPSDLMAPGHIRSAQKGYTYIMRLDRQRSETLSHIGRLLDQAGFNCTVMEDVFPYIWEKVAFNSALNSLAAVTRLTVGELGSNEHSKRLAQKVCAEVLGVAEKKGVAVSRERVQAMLEEAFRQHRDHQPSMLQDILSGRRTEIEAINGAVLKEAHQLGLEVPFTECLYRLVKTIEDHFRSS